MWLLLNNCLLTDELSLLKKLRWITVEVSLKTLRKTAVCLTQQEFQMKKLRCRDVGFDCDREITAKSEAEILTQAAEHAQNDHGLKEITPEVVAAVKAAIKEA